MHLLQQISLVYIVEVSGGGKPSSYPAVPTQYTVDKVAAYNKWGEAYAGDNFEPIEPEDTLGFSDKMQSVYDNMSEHSGLRKKINSEMGEK